MRKTVDILGVPVDSITMNEAVEKVKMFLLEEGVHTIYTPNAEIMMAAHRDPCLKNILCEADMLVADGAGVVLASRILGMNLPEKVSGFDLVKNTFSIKINRRVRFFLFGARPGIVEAAAQSILTGNPGVDIAGYRNGYFSKDDENDIINQINSSSADILLVALGAPKQEKWIHEHRQKLNAKVCIGVGGTFDVLSGNVRLAPEFFRKNGFEWLYRLYKEPWRFKRMLDLPRFIILAVIKRLKNRK